MTHKCAWPRILPRCGDWVQWYHRWEKHVSRCHGPRPLTEMRHAAWWRPHQWIPPLSHSLILSSLQDCWFRDKQLRLKGKKSPTALCPVWSWPLQSQHVDNQLISRQAVGHRVLSLLFARLPEQRATVLGWDSDKDKNSFMGLAHQELQSPSSRERGGGSQERGANFYVLNILLGYNRQIGKYINYKCTAW